MNDIYWLVNLIILIKRMYPPAGMEFVLHFEKKRPFYLGTGRFPVQNISITVLRNSNLDGSELPFD